MDNEYLADHTNFPCRFLEHAMRIDAVDFTPQKTKYESLVGFQRFREGMGHEYVDGVLACRDPYNRGTYTKDGYDDAVDVSGEGLAILQMKKRFSTSMLSLCFGPPLGTRRCDDPNLHRYGRLKGFEVVGGPD